VIGVLNAGATIHAVEYDEHRNRYLVRAELFEFLSSTAKKAFESNESHANLAELEKIVGVALLPNVGENAETVLHYMHPISEDRGFTAEIKLGEVEEAHKRTVRNVLNAGATHERVQRAGNDATHYYVHKDLYKTLARIRGRTLFSGTYGQPQLAAPGVRDGGALHGGALPAQQRTAIADHSRQVPKADAPQSDAKSKLKGEFRSALLNAMGLEDLQYMLVSRPNVMAEAIAAGKSLEQAKVADSMLGPHVTWQERQLRDALQSAYKSLWGRFGGEQIGIDALNAARDEIEHVLPALMLAPKGPYEKILHKLIEELEPAAGANELNAREQELLDRLNHHAAAIAMVTRDSPESWRKAGQLVFAWDDGNNAHATNA
jgi:hypothetical protein